MFGACLQPGKTREVMAAEPAWCVGCSISAAWQNATYPLSRVGHREENHPPERLSPDRRDFSGVDPMGWWAPDPARLSKNGRSRIQLDERIRTAMTICYTFRHIRPLAVRPPVHPGSVPNPWGFFVSGLRRMGAGGVGAE